MVVIEISRRKLKGTPWLSKESSRKVEDGKDFKRFGEDLYKRILVGEMPNKKDLISFSNKYVLEPIKKRVYSRINNITLEVRGFRRNLIISEYLGDLE